MFRRRSRASADEVDWWSVPAITDLRLMLLAVAMSYGLLLAITGRDRTHLGEWRDLVRWRMELMQRIVARATEFHEWPGPPGLGEFGSDDERIVEALAEIERRGFALEGEPSGSLGGDLQEMLERLVLSARAVENLGAEPLNDIPPGQWTAGSALLGATEDSLVLMADEDDSSAHLAAGLEEMHDRIVAARREGVWAYLVPGTTGPIGTHPPHASRKRMRLAIEARNQLGLRWSATSAFYGELEPDGRELSADMQAAVREHLRNGAVTLRHVDQHRAVMDRMNVARFKDMDVASLIVTLRNMQRSLVLTVSEDPARRQQAMTLPEMARLIAPVHYQWNPG
jgi:hypothetical protein